MLAALVPVTALLASVFVLIAGHGLTSTLIPLAGSSFGFSDSSIGLVGSAYFAGMLAGSFTVAYILRAAGHIRAFSALSALTMAITLVMPMVAEPGPWIGLRAAHGFCIAALYTTIESWLNTRTHKDWRTRVLGVYNIMHFAGSAAGQQALTFIPPTDFRLFSLAALLMGLSVLPLCFTRAEPPAPPEGKRLRLGWLWSIAPASAVTAFLIGWANGSFWSLAPLWGSKIGFTPTEIAIFITSVIVGCAAAQLPAGYVGDRMDRRVVLAGFAALATFCSLLLAFITNLATAATVGLIYGTALPTLYVMCSAHANDRAGPHRAVEVSSSVLFLYCLGALVGPALTASLMNRPGPFILYLINSAVYGMMFAYIVVRIRMREKVEAITPVEPEPVRVK